MEESINRAEKLVHATSSALAQMKYNLTFDNLNGEGTMLGRSSFVRSNKGKPPFSLEDELEQFEKEFRSDANEMLTKMDKILDSSQYMPSRISLPNQPSKAREKMRELNRILASRRSDVAKSSDTEQSKQKLLSLINEENDIQDLRRTSNTKFTTSSKSSDGGRETCMRAKETPSKTHMPPEEPKAREKSNEELKKKLLETQEVVDRGFQMVLHLRQRVDHMAKAEKKLERTPSTEKTVTPSDRFNVDRNRAISDSNETVKTISPERCTKCHHLKEKRKKRRNKSENFRDGEKSLEKEKNEVKTKRNIHEKVDREKSCLVNVRREEEAEKKKVTKPKLNLHRLPSIDIRGGLQIQRVHSLGILPEEQESLSVKANTSIKMVSHEEIEREKAKILLEGIKRENCFFCQTIDDKIKHVECFNCGNLIQVREKQVNPKEINELLLQCDFNVFDPRIDDFVEKCEKITPTDERQVAESPRAERELPTKRECLEKESHSTEAKVEKVKKHIKINELSQQLTRRYIEGANQLESDHQEFENILKSLFRKIDESRKFFDFDCDKSKTVETKRKTKLTATKPLVVSLEESLPSAIGENSNNDVEPGKKEKSTETNWDSRGKRLRRREKRKKLDRKDLINKFKSRTWQRSDTDLKPLRDTRKEFPMVSESSDEDVQDLLNGFHDQRKEEVNQEIEEELMGRIAETDSGATGGVNDKNGIPSDLDGKTENDYESDFERESPTFRQQADEETVEEEEESGVVRSVKKLSTISEVDSDLEKKLSDKNPSEKCEKLTATGSPDGKELKRDIEHVLTKAFERGIAYTLKRQTEVLDAIPAAEPVIMARSSLRPVTDQIMDDVTATQSPSEQLKSSKSKSEVSVSQKSSSTEVVASLKEVLSALKDQFERTQTLADKLTENVKNLNVSKENEKIEEWREEKAEREVPIDEPESNDELMKNLEKLKKDLEGENTSHKKSPFTLLQNSPEFSWNRNSSNDQNFSRSPAKTSPKVVKPFTEEEPFQGTSLTRHSVRPGDVKSQTETVTDADKNRTQARNQAQNFSPVRCRDENTLSEGEILSNIVLEEDSSMQSIGELVSESISEGSDIESMPGNERKLSPSKFLMRPNNHQI